MSCRDPQPQGSADTAARWLASGRRRLRGIGARPSLGQTLRIQFPPRLLLVGSHLGPPRFGRNPLSLHRPLLHRARGVQVGGHSQLLGDAQPLALEELVATAAGVAAGGRTSRGEDVVQKVIGRSLRMTWHDVPMRRCPRPKGPLTHLKTCSQDMACQKKGRLPCLCWAVTGGANCVAYRRLAECHWGP